MSLSSVPSALVNQQWAKDTFVEAFPNNFFNAYMGDSNAIIQVMHDLDNEAGDRIHYGLVMGLDETQGIEGDSVLIGQEEALTIYNETMYIDQLRHGVRLKGRMDERKARFSMRSKAKEQLKAWLPRAIDYHIFQQLAGNPAYTFAGNTGVASDQYHTIVCGAQAWSTDVPTTEAAMAADDFLTTWEIDWAVERAKTLEPMMRPIRIEGGEYYLLVIHPYVANQLKYGLDTKWYDAFKDALPRSSDHPFFRGALGMWNGVVIREHRFVPTINNSVYRCFFLGAQAATCAFAKKKIWAEDTTSDTADYGNRIGFAAGFIGGFKKNIFNSTDFGMITVLSYGAAMVDQDHSS